MKDELTQTWNVLKPEDEKSFLEIRFTPTNFRTNGEKYIFFRELEKIKKLYPEIKNNKVSFFINNYEDFVKILTYNKYYFLEHGKCCYGVNPRYVKKDGTIDGTYESLKYYNYIFFDIDAHGSLEGFRGEMFNKYVGVVIDILIKYNLKNPIIIHSGGGKHLLYKIKPQKITDGRREWMKEWVKEINNLFVNKEFVVDCLHDATRILSLPNSLNVKRDKYAFMEQPSNWINNEFKIHSKRIKKFEPTKINEGSYKERIKRIIGDPLTQILLKEELPAGGRNNILIFQLKILLKINGFEERDEFVRELFRRIQLIQKDVFPANFPKNTVSFNKNIVNSYFINHNLKTIYK